MLVARGAVVSTSDLGLRTPSGEPNLAAMTLDEAERVLVRKALDRHAGNVTHAAQDLGVSRAALYRKVERHGLR